MERTERKSFLPKNKYFLHYDLSKYSVFEKLKKHFQNSKLRKNVYKESKMDSNVNIAEYDN